MQPSTWILDQPACIEAASGCMMHRCDSGLPGDTPEICVARQGRASGAPVTVMSSFAAKTGPSASISFIRASIFVGSPSGALLSRSATRRTLLQWCAHRLEDDTKTKAPRERRKGGKCKSGIEGTPGRRAWARTRDERVHQVGDVDPAQERGRGVALLGHRLLLQVLQVGADDDGRAQNLRPVELLLAAPSAWSRPEQKGALGHDHDTVVDRPERRRSTKRQRSSRSMSAQVPLYVHSVLRPGAARYAVLSSERGCMHLHGPGHGIRVLQHRQLLVLPGHSGQGRPRQERLRRSYHASAVRALLMLAPLAGPILFLHLCDLDALRASLGRDLYTFHASADWAAARPSPRPRPPLPNCRASKLASLKDAGLATAVYGYDQLP
jgi:hypothetical protein